MHSVSLRVYRISEGHWHGCCQGIFQRRTTSACRQLSLTPSQLGRSKLLKRPQCNAVSGHQPRVVDVAHQSFEYDDKVSVDVQRQDRDELADGKPVVRWYHQLTPWSKNRRLSDPDNPDADDDTGEIKNLKLEIDRLDEELREMQEGANGKTLFEPILRDLSTEDQQFVRDNIQKQKLEQNQRADALRKFLPRLEIKWTLPTDQRAYLRDLNECIQLSLLGFGDYTIRRRLWRSYARCKAFLPPFSHLIPYEAWMALYRAQALAASHDDANWARHSIILLEDMRDALESLEPDQAMLYIEALRFEGRHKEGIAEWKALRHIVEKNDRALAEYELLGVRLFTSQGDLGKAEDLAAKFLDNGDISECRILIPIMDTWIQRGVEIGIKHAWALYLTLKMQLGSDITVDDYDNVCLSFLNGGRTDLALAVFRDMMLTGQELGYDSVDLYWRCFSTVDKLHNASTKTAGVNKIFLTGMTVMPRAFENKFFYAKWMKRLIGMDQADSAAAVVELMYERRIKPDAKHLNGIVGAWLRTNSDEHKAKAERMAWAMINRRLAFVRLKRKANGQALPVEASTKDGIAKTAQPLKRNIPLATIETFSLLLQHYARRKRIKDVEFLQGALQAGEMTPNSYWTNHLLFMDLRSGRHDSAWERYMHCFDDVVKPDLETFACLWECELAHLKVSRLQSHSWCVFPEPAMLFSHLHSWLRSCNKRERQFAQEDFSRNLYDIIIRCMVQSGDFAGTIVALHVLKDIFQYYPSLGTTNTITKQVGQMTLKQFSSRAGRAARLRDKEQKQRSEWVAKKELERVQHERGEFLAAAGYDEFEHLEDSIQSRERLHILTEYLKIFLGGKGRYVNESIATAASKMGISNLSIEDHLRSSPDVD